MQFITFDCMYRCCLLQLPERKMLVSVQCRFVCIYSAFFVCPGLILILVISESWQLGIKEQIGKANIVVDPLSKFWSLN